MAISVFPAPVTSSLNASAITAVAANTLYEGRATFDSGVYTITCASATIAKVEFYSGAGTLITTAITSSGTVSVNLASNADRIRVWTNTGSDIVVTITKTAAALTNQFSGTLDTITTTSTYTGTSTSGFGYAIVVGGGGGAGSIGNYTGGGGSGGITEKIVALTGSMPVVIGAAGVGSAGANGTAGGDTTFAGLTAKGGSGSSGNSGAAGGVAGSGGTYNTAGAVGGDGASGGNQVSPTYLFVKNGSTGGGGGGAGSNGGNGGGSGIGTGGKGRGSANLNVSGDATGYGAGGGGYYEGGARGGNGSPGVVYVLKF